MSEEIQYDCIKLILLISAIPIVTQALKDLKALDVTVLTCEVGEEA